MTALVNWVKVLTMNNAAHFYSDHQALECQVCQGYGTVGQIDASEDGWAQVTCKACDGLTFVECSECAHGTAADIEFAEDGVAYCVECLIGINDIALERVRTSPAAWVKRATDAGKAFLDFLAPVPNGDDWGDEETELRARAVSYAPPAPSIVEYYAPPKSPAHDSCVTQTELQVVL